MLSWCKRQQEQQNIEAVTAPSMQTVAPGDVVIFAAIFWQTVP